MPSLEDKPTTNLSISPGHRSSKMPQMYSLDLKDVPHGLLPKQLTFSHQQVLGTITEWFLRERKAITSLPESVLRELGVVSFDQMSGDLESAGLLCRPEKTRAFAPTRAGMRFVLDNGPARGCLTDQGRQIIVPEDCAFVVPNASVAFLDALDRYGKEGVAPLSVISCALGFTRSEQDIVAVARFALSLVKKGRLHVSFPPAGEAEVTDLLRHVEPVAQDTAELKVPKKGSHVERRPSISPEEGEQIISLVNAAGQAGLSILDVHAAMPHIGMGQISKFFKKLENGIESFEIPRRPNGVRFLFRISSTRGK